ncbi:methyltransferase domain-containing protein [Nostoc sp. CCY0012]|uniref:class I SAM-dependent methyltransferase n=1 Tax=Nostoc sp. CCY0012 TaxID=1056123 RepID=UPI0039C66DC6
MIEFNNPEIDVDELMQKICQDVANRLEKNQIVTVNTENVSQNNWVNNFNYIESLLFNAESRANVRTKWPDKLNRFPFNINSKLQKFILKIINFFFKDQREVNLNIILALKESVNLNRSLIQHNQILHTQVSVQVNALNNRFQNLETELKVINDNLENHINKRLSNLEQQKQELNNWLIDINNNTQGLSNRLSTVDIHFLEMDVRLNAVDTRCQGLDESLDAANINFLRMDERLGVADTSIQKLNEHLSNVDSLILEINQRLDAMDHIQNNKILPSCLEMNQIGYISEAISKSNIPVKDGYKHNIDSLFYYLFENVFYNAEIVKEKQKIYLQYIDKTLNEVYSFLDAGCGRGEFLQNLRESNINSIGVDINNLEISLLAKKNFSVFCSDILQYLNSHEQQYSGVSSFQVIEHLDFNYLNEFLSAVFQKLVSNGVILLETINPHSLYALSNFYQDPTHIKPIPPEMLVFLLEWHGFKKIKVVYSSLLPEQVRIFKDQRMNYQDYAIIGYKP